jgi:hypothetical protein
MYMARVRWKYVILEALNELRKEYSFGTVEIKRRISRT